MSFSRLFFITISISTFLLALPSMAAEKPQFPETLFGVRLGGIYSIGGGKDHNDVGNIPIKKFAGIQKFLGHGIHYYFEPTKKYKAFRYIEKPKDKADEYFETTFSLYLLPIIPKEADLNENLEDIKWEVISIKWHDQADNENDAYFWAEDLCKSVKIDLHREPEVTEYFGSKFYCCKFKKALKELVIKNIGKLKVFKLSYSNTEFDRKNEAVDVILRKLQMEEIRPY